VGLLVTLRYVGRVGEHADQPKGLRGQMAVWCAQPSFPGTSRALFGPVNVNVPLSQLTDAVAEMAVGRGAMRK
jgi:hypothetical protein